MSREWYPFVSLFKFAESRERLWILVGFCSTILSSWSSPTLYVVFGNVVSLFADFQANKTSNNIDFPFLEDFCKFREPNYKNVTIQQEFMFKIEFFSIFLLGIGMFYVLFAYLSVLCFELSAHSQILNIKYRLFSSILERPFDWFDRENAQKEDSTQELKANEFSTRISNDLKAIERGMNENLCLFIYFTSSILANLFYSLYFGWKLALSIFALTPIIAVSSAMLTKIQSSFVRKEIKAYGEAGSYANEIFYSILTVFAFNGENKALNDYRKKLEPTKRMFLKRSFFNAAGNSIVWAAIYCGFALGLYYGVYLCKHEPSSYSVGTIILVFWCSAAVGWNLGYAAPYMENVQTACTVAKILWKNIRTLEDAKFRGKLEVKEAPTIEFKNVHFAYQTRLEDKIFTNLDLSIEAGKTVAIVGSTGSGKSSLLQLLQRFYIPHSGQILIDGQDIGNLEVGCLREQFGVVGQEPVLFDMSIFENIRLGASGHNFEMITLDHVVSAAKEANAHDFVSQLPDGYRTKVGQGGAQLSGGQKQRIAIARALLKNPRILLLDEATSALDAQSEYLVQSALERASKNRTTIIVAHRLSTIIHADRIICLSNEGTIVESGNHQELMKNDGHYKRLFQGQLENLDSMEQENIFKHEESVRVPAASRKYTLEDCDHVVESTKLVEKQRWVTGRLFRMLFRYKSISIFAVFSAALFGLCIPIYAYLFGDFVYEVFGKNQNTSELDQNLAKNYSFKFLYLALFAFLTSFTQSMFFAVASQKLTRKLRLNTFWAVLEHDVSWFDQNAPGSICTKLSEYPNDIQTAIGPKTAMICQAFATLLVSISIGFYTSWRLSSVTVWFVPIIAISSSATASLLGHQSNKEREQNAQAASLAAEALTPSGIRTIKTLHKERYFAEKYKTQLLQNEKKYVQVTNRKSFSIALALATPTMAYALSFYYGGRLISDGQLKVSHFLQVVEAMIFGAVVFGQACFFSSDFARAHTAATELFELIDWARDKNNVEKQPRVGSSNFLIGYALNNCRGEIEFSHIDFNYPSRIKAQILKNFSLKINSGTRVALVGSSGCGKSTILQLLLRFYSPNRGKILLDGVNIAELSRTWLRSQISFVSQEPVLFSANIRQNIAYGLNDQESDVRFEDIRQAACKACADTFVTRLPEQYETHICSSLLSGGQKQRIAIARAMIRNSPILLFDEATSALDSESETLIEAAIESATSGRTCLIVAHRLSTIKNAERIVFIDDGRVCEDGTHDELLNLRGKYFTMWNSQFKSF